MEKVKIAQIGIGHDHAPMIFSSLTKQSDIFEVVGYYLPDGEAERYSEKLECFNGYKKLTIEEIMENPEVTAVTIETEEANLSSYALMAANYGKHIHMDKPGGMNTSEFEELIETARAKKLIFHMGYMYRYNPEIMKLMSDDGREELGEIISVETHMNGIYPDTPEKRQWLNQFPGGNMFFLGCHMIDVILNLQGIPDKITSFNKCSGAEGVTSEDFAMAVLEYPHSTSFVKANAREVIGYRRRQIVVCGSKKTVEIKPVELYYKEGLRTKVYEYKSAGEKEEISEFFDRYDTMMASFAEMVRGDKENPWSYDYELILYRCIMKACGI